MNKFQCRDLLAPVAFAASLCPGLLGQIADQQVALLPIEQLTATYSPLPPLPFWTFLRGHVDHRTHILGSGNSGGYQQFDQDDIVGILQARDATFHEDGVELSMTDGWLLLTSSEAHVQRTGKFLRTFREHVSSPVHVEVAVIAHDGTFQPPSVVDAGQARGLFEGREVRWRGAAHTPAGIPTSLGKHRMIAYRRSYDGHVTEQRELAAPIADHVFDGVLCNVAPYRLVGSDDLVVQVQFAIGECVELVEHDPGLGSIGKLQRPVVDSSAGNMSGRIANGGALVFNAIAPDERGGSVTLAVRASWQPPTTKLPDEFAILDTITITGGRTCNLAAFPDARFEEDQIEEVTSRIEWSGPRIEQGLLEEILTTQVAEDTWGDTSHMMFRAGKLFVAADQEVLDAVRKRIKAMQDAFLHTAEVDYRAGAHRIVMPALAGHGHAIRHGRMTTAIARVEGNIAKAASILAPYVVDLQDGVDLLAQPYVHDQTVGAQLRWSTQRLDAAPTGTSMPTTQRSARSHAGDFPTDGLPFGDGPFGAEHWRVRLR